MLRVIVSQDIGSIDNLFKNIRDMSVFYPKHGMLTEPSGLAISFSTYLFQPVHYMVPKTSPMHVHILNCYDNNITDYKNIIESVYNITIKRLYNHISPYQSSIIASNATRSRRSVILAPFFVAAATMGLSIELYNSYQVTKIREESQNLLTQIRQLEGIQEETKLDLQSLTEKVNEIGSVILPNMQRTIRVLYEKSSCMEQGLVGLSNVFKSMTERVYIRTLNVFNGIYSGHITPDLISADYIQEKLLNRPDLEGSIYHDDISLVYQLGKVIPYHISRSPILLSGMIVLPRLLKSHIGSVITVSRVPIPYNGKHIILDEPETVIRDDDARKIWTPDLNKCNKLTSAYICPIHILYNKHSPCLTNIIWGNNTPHCNFKFADTHSFVTQTISGLLVSGKIDEYFTVKTNNDGSRKTTKHNFSKSDSYFLTNTNGSEIGIDGEIYMLDPTPIEITQSQLTVIGNGSISIQQDPLNYESINMNLNKLNKTDDAFFKSHLGIISILISLSFCLVGLYRYITYVYNQHIDLSRHYQAHEMVKLNDSMEQSTSL